MDLIERAVRELRGALGDRLPPAVTEARLREARGHLQMATADVGEEEAVRRFGLPRRVANEIVRSHRGYTGQSALRLSFGLGLCLPLVIVVQVVWFRLVELDPEPERLALAVLPWTFPLMLALFAIRVIQTRRWLAGPMALWHFGALLVLMTLNSPVPRPPIAYERSNGVEVRRYVIDRLRPTATDPARTATLTMYGAGMVVVWSCTNLLALGLGSLGDRRRVARG